MKKVFLLLREQSFVCMMVLFFIILICQTQASAQTQDGIDSMNVMTKFHVNPNPADTLDPTYDIIYTVILNDTVNIKKIHLNAGVSQGDKDVFNLPVKLDGSGNLPTDVVYERKGNVAVIILSSRHLLTNYYYQAKTEDDKGNFSNPHTYHYK